MSQFRINKTHLSSKTILTVIVFILLHQLHFIHGQSMQTNENNPFPSFYKKYDNIGNGKTNYKIGKSPQKNDPIKWKTKISNGFNAAQDQFIGRTKDMIQWTAVSHAAEKVVEQSTNPNKINQIKTFISQYPKKLLYPKSTGSVTKRISKKVNKHSLPLGKTVNKAMKTSLKASSPTKKMMQMVPNVVESVVEHSTTKATTRITTKTILHRTGKNIQNTVSHTGTSVLSSTLDHTAEHMITNQIPKNLLKQKTKSMPSNLIQKSTSTIEKSMEHTIANNARRKVLHYRSKQFHPTSMKFQKLKSYLPQKVSKTLKSLKKIRFGRRILTTIPLLGCTIAAHSCIQDGKRSYTENSKISSILFGIASCLSSIDVFAHLYIAASVSQLFDMGHDVQLHYALAELLSFWVAILSIFLAVLGEFFSNDTNESLNVKDKEKTIIT